MIGIRRYPYLSRKIVGRSHRDDPKRHVVSVQTIHDFIQRPVSTHRRDHIDAAACGIGGEGRGVADGVRDHRLDEVSLLAHPVDEMSNLGIVGTRAVDDQRDVLGSHAAR